MSSSKRSKSKREENLTDRPENKSSHRRVPDVPSFATKLLRPILNPIYSFLTMFSHLSSDIEPRFYQKKYYFYLFIEKSYSSRKMNLPSLKIESPRKEAKIKRSLFAQTFLMKNELSIIEENVEKSHFTKTFDNLKEEVLEFKEKKEKNFVQNLVRINLINLFVKNLQRLSGKFGPLGNKQLKIINDVSTDINYNPKVDGDENSDLNRTNYLVKMIVI